MSNTSEQQDKFSQLSPLQKATFALKKLDTKLNSILHEPIAIIGMGCSFPGGATTPEKFWELLQTGSSARKEIPANRWDINAYYDPDRTADGKIVTRFGHFINAVDQFDPGFFGISPQEAIAIDPQHRLLLEVSWQALERAGYKLERLSAAPVGVFVGNDGHDYEQLMQQHLQQEPNSSLVIYTGTGNAISHAAGRLAYTFGFTGPTITIDTACSSSLVAIHQACNSIRLGECQMAIAGGVKLHLTPESYIFTSRAGMLSPDGLCKTFDISADGYGRGEGCGMVVLKRLSQAQEDKDPILALIRGSAVNQDGPSSGLTVPNGQSQQKAIKQALTQARVHPAEISYLEVHGTGTSLGDPIEVNAAVAVLGEERSPEQPLWIGTVKTNIGHLEAAAGVSALIKVVLSMQHQQLPAHLHLQEPNPKIDWQPWLKVPQVLTPWAVPKGRLAGLSSFGFTGTNAHVVLEEAPIPVKIEDLCERPYHIFTLSTKCEKALQELGQRYQEFLGTNSTAAIANICFTANTGRSHFDHRLALVAESTQKLLQQLKVWETGDEITGLFRGQVTSQKRPKIAFLFPGQGSQYVDMGRQLYETQPVFRRTLDQCDRILQSYLEKSILEIIYPANTQELTSSVLDQTAYTQPALFAIEYALVQLWQSWGIKPDVLMGHSVGEYVAATVAGVLSLEAGLKLIAHRGKLMQQLPTQGEMVAVMASQEKINQLIAPYQEKVAIAAINGSLSVVISGETEAMRAVRESLEAQGIQSKQLPVFHAFHSPLMEPLLGDFAAIANQITYHQPQIPLVSNLTGTIADESITTVSYWVNHVRQPVQFAQGMETLQAQGCDIFLEIGPKPILLAMGRQCLPAGTETWLPSLRPEQSDWQQMLQSLAQLYVRGVKIDWQGFDQDYSRSKVVLPTYPWQRQRYWIENSQRYSSQLHQRMYPLLGSKIEVASTGQTIYHQHINLSNYPWIADHRVYDMAVIPGVSYIAMTFAAVGTPAAVEEVNFIQPLFLPTPDTTRETQLLIHSTDGTETQQNVEVFSRNATDGEQWQQHTEITLLKTPPALPILRVDIESLHQQLRPIDNHLLNNIYAQVSLVYGSMLQAVHQAWIGKGISLLEIQVPEALESQLAGEPIHPVLLDACTRLTPETLDLLVDEPGVFWAPYQVQRMSLSRPAPRRFYAYVNQPTRLNQQLQTRAYDIHLLDEMGQSFGYIDGFTLRRAPREAFLRSLPVDRGDWLYQVHWQPQPTAPENQSINLTEPGSWLIFASPTGIGKHLAEFLEQQGQHCILVTPGENYQKLASRHYQINPINASEFPQLLQESLQQEPPLRGIFHLWSLQSKIASQTLTQELQKSQELGCGSVLHLAQAIIKNQDIKTTLLWLVTQGCQSVGKESFPIECQQASLWGLGRVIAQEYEELQCRCIDLDPTEEDAQAVTALLQELLSPRDENQIAYRQQIRYVARLERQQTALTSTQGGLQLPSQKPFQLKLSEYGLLDNLFLQTMERTAPGSQEVEIQVQAVGLNFRDVLNALGLLKYYYAEHFGITSAEQLTFGFECVGTIVAVGEGVSHLQVGDEVIANLLPDAFSSFITTRVEFVVPKPRSLSLVEATTIPLAFSTAYHALHNLAKVQPGDRVLIHAAAGAVGQAAVQLVQQAGAEVFATASPQKWEFLKSMGVEHVMNSRTLDFTAQIMNLTQGRGVDVVLNSLNGEFITKSFEALAIGGRFVEIGKIGIWDENQVKQKRPDARYFTFDLWELSQENPSLIVQIMDSFIRQFAQGDLKPLPHKVFDLEQVVKAFRYMQQGKHIGKVVVLMPQVVEKPASIQPEGSYLITGGLGALGLKTAKWMAEQGAKHLILTGRQQPSEKAWQTIQELEDAGTQVLVLCGDISQKEDVARIIEDIKASLPPLRGLIHGAGVLDDGLLSNMSWEQFTQVLAPKVQGAWHLHCLTKDLPLDFFVCFSSIAALLGSPGQGNYAAANAFMDALVHYRRGAGLPGLSINWGPWAGGGMATSLASQHQNHILTQGISPIAPEAGLQLLANLLARDSVQVGVLPINWSKFVQRLPIGKKIPFLQAFTSQVGQSGTGKSNFRQRLEVTPVEERRELLVNHIREQVAKVLGLNPSAPLDLQRDFFELGMDSLKSIELVNYLQTSLVCSIPATFAFDYPTVGEFVDYLAQKVLGDENQKSELNSIHKMVDLQTEAVLDPTIYPVEKSNLPLTEANSILLTGVTGFLGAFLLYELLQQTQAERIYCLVRAADAESGTKRIQNNLESYNLWHQHFQDRIIPVIGDLSQPQLGLSSEEFQRIASQIDTIYHSAALLNYVYPYELLKPTNVLGTQEVLRLASQIKVKPVHYISSVAVFGSSAYYQQVLSESDQPTHSEEIYLGYSESKWVAEKLVMMARDRGIPVCIYRPPFISGHSQTGVWNTDDIICRIIKGCIQMGSIADLDFMLDLSPVDYVSRGIVYLSRQKDSIGKVFHLNNPQQIHWGKLGDFIQSLGYAIDRVSYQTWLTGLNNNRLSQENPLSSLVPFFEKTYSEEQLTVMELMQRFPQFNCDKTHNILKENGIVCPFVNAELLNTYFLYFIRTGFLHESSPSVRG